MDKTLNGGFIRPGLHILTANSGGGKSLMLCNFSLNIIEQGYNVLYITLELDEEFVGARFDTMISEIPEAEVIYKKQQVIDKIQFKNKKSGSLHIKYMDAQSKPEDIKNFLIQFGMLNKFYPDCLVIDYLDLVAPNGGRYDGAFERDKMSSEQLRNIGKEFNCSVLTASQQNREAISAASINQSHIAGGISKINTCDLAVSIAFDEEARAAGEIQFTYMKTRYSPGVGSNFILQYDPISMRVTDSSFFSSEKNKPETVRDNCSLIDNLDV
jgi:KaiC/GvpD/RAD55 family RecA-like ATPase